MQQPQALPPVRPRMAPPPQQPDSLKLSVSLCILRHLHAVCEELDLEYGDMSAEKKLYLSAIQGRVTRYSGDRNYDYLLAKIREVKDYLGENLVPAQLSELAATALEIYNRCDNRRRMGWEIIVLALLASDRSTWFEVPEKYHSRTFVLDMLVSCRHRFQKLDKAYFWSRQTESLLSLTFSTTRNLTCLKLSSVSDKILRCLAVNCRKLLDVELQFAPDVTDGGLLAFVGKAVEKKDKGNPICWPRAVHQLSDFGPSKDWFVKDSLLFTHPLQTPPPHSFEPTHDTVLPPLYDTGFGCREIARLRINGEFTFPPHAARQRDSPTMIASLKMGGGASHHQSPVLELGIYGLLLFLKKMQRFIMPGLPMAIARLAGLLEADPMVSRRNFRLSLQSLSFDRDLLREEELVAVARLCGKSLSELNNVSPDCVTPSDNGGGGDDDDDDVGGYFPPTASGGGDFSSVVGPCRCLHEFQNLSMFAGRMGFACFVQFAKVRGDKLVKIHLSSAPVFDLTDIVLLRTYAPNLEILEGTFVIRTNEEGSHVRKHQNNPGDLGELFIQARASPFSKEVRSALASCPLKRLRSVDIEGRITLLSLQLLAGNADNLEELHLTNSPPLVGGDSKALSDDWIDGLLRVNRLSNVRSLTLRMDSLQTADCGTLTERGLVMLLDHFLEHCHKIGEVVGEFTRIPDTKLAAFNAKYVELGLRRLSVRNAVPYRRFDNDYDSDRHYGVNEGYRAMIQLQQEAAASAAAAAAAAAAGGGGGGNQQQQHHSWWRGNGDPGGMYADAGKRHRRFKGYVFRPFDKGDCEGEERAGQQGARRRHVV